MFPDIVHVVEFPYLINERENINSFLEKGWILLCVAPSGSINDGIVIRYSLGATKDVCEAHFKEILEHRNQSRINPTG